jgi:hypothetical protein
LRKGEIFWRQKPAKKARGETSFTLPPRPVSRKRKEGFGRVRRIYIRRLTFIVKSPLKAPHGCILGNEKPTENYEYDDK